MTNELLIRNRNSILDYCSINSITIEEFNSPVSISLALKDCSGLFKGCKSFNQKVIIPHGVVNCMSMFEGCESFNQQVVIPETTKCIKSMFDGCVSQNRTVHVKRLQDYPLKFNDCGLSLNAICSVYVVENPDRIFCDSNGLTYKFNGDFLTVYDKTGVRDFCKDNLIGYLYFNYPVLIGDNVVDVSGLLRDMPSFKWDLALPPSVKYYDKVVPDNYKGSVVRL